MGGGALSIIGNTWRWLQRYGLGIPIVLGLFLVVSLAAAFAIAPGFRDPERTDAGHIDDYEIGQPGYYEVERFWVVRTSETDVLVLYDRDPHSGCRSLWYVNREYMGVTGWFNETCQDHYYDYTGRCFGEGCERGMDRFSFKIEDGNILVDLSSLNPGPEYDPSATPLAPPGSDTSG